MPTEMFNNMTQLYNDKYKSYENVKRQIERFSSLMTDLKVGNYKFRFDDAYKIGEWLDEAKQCNLVDTCDVDYKFVKDYNQYFVDFVKILVNNNLKINLSNKDKYTDSAKKYKFTITQIEEYSKENPFKDIRKQTAKIVKLKKFDEQVVSKMYLTSDKEQKKFVQERILNNDAYTFYTNTETFISIPQAK